MPDEPTPPELTVPSAPVTPPEPQPSAPPAAVPPVDVTQSAEFKAAVSTRAEEIFSNRLERERGRIRKELQSENNVPTPTPDESSEPGDPPPPDKPNGQGRRTKVERTLDFRDAIADYGFDRSMRKRLESIYLAAGGDENVDDWLKDFITDMGLAKSQQAAPTQDPQPTPQAEPTPPPADPSGPTASDRGGPTAATDQFTTSDPERWGEDHVARLVAEAESKKENVAQYVKNAFLAGLRGKVVVLGRSK